MARIYLYNLAAHGHVNPTLPLAKELVSRGHEVYFYTTETFEAAVKATGATFRAYTSEFEKIDIKPDPQMKKLMGEMPLHLLREADHVLPQLLNTLEPKPDLIMYDVMCLAGRFMPKLAGVPGICLFPTYPMTQAIFPQLGIQRPEMDKSVALELHDLADAFCEKYGIEDYDPQHAFFHRDDFNVVFLPRAFHPFADGLDAGFEFIGPSIGQRPEDKMPLPLTGAPVIYISLGTVFNQWPQFFQICFDAFKDMPVDVLMSIGEKTNQEGLGEVPANFTLFSSAPQLKILPHTSVFITHCGMNSTMESLYFDVPMVGIPQMPEQAITAGQIGKLNLGVHLEREKVTAESLRAAVEKIVNSPEIHENVHRMGNEVRSAGGVKRGAITIEAYLNRSNQKPLPSQQTASTPGSKTNQSVPRPVT